MSEDRLESTVQSHTNQKRPWQGALAARLITKGAASVMKPIIFALPDSVKFTRLNRGKVCYNQVSLKSETALVLEAPNAASDHRTKGTRRMATPIVSNQFASIQLTRGRVALVDSIDQDLCDVKWYANIDRTTGNYYAVRRLPKQNGRRPTELMHRTIVSRMIGRPMQSSEQVDHINHNTLDNRRGNLRLATPTQNQRNRGAQKNNTSGHKGVSWDEHSQRWRAYIGVDGTTRHIGLFSELDEAVAARKRVEDKLFGEFSPDNRIDEPIVDFDTPAGRTQADRIVMALRYPSRADAEPIASVSKVIAGGVYLLAVYDADILAALLRMGWACEQAQESEAGR